MKKKMTFNDLYGIEEEKDRIIETFEDLYPEEKLKEKATRLREMATVCKKTDGYGIIIEVYSEDHGILGDKENPAHAHLKTASGEYLGKFAITLEPPRRVEYIFDCDKNQLIPSKYKNILVKWGSSKNDEDIPCWSFLKSIWKSLHP